MRARGSMHSPRACKTAKTREFPKTGATPEKQTTRYMTRHFPRHATDGRLRYERREASMTSTCVMTSVPRFASACLPAGRDGVAPPRDMRASRRETRDRRRRPSRPPRRRARGPIVLTRAAPEGASTPARRWDKSKSAGARTRTGRTSVRSSASGCARARRPSSSQLPFQSAVPPETETLNASPRFTLTHDNLFFASSLDLSG